MKTNVKIAMGMVLLVMVVYASPAKATLLAYEGFDYDVAELDGTDGGSGFAGAWNGTSVLSNDDTSLVHAGNPGTTGSRMSNSTENGSIRPLVTPLTFNQGDEWYMSWLMKPASNKWLAIKLSKGAHGAGEYNHRGFMFYQSGSNYAVGGTAAPAVQWDGGYTPGDTLFVVAKLVADPDNWRWINHVSVYEDPQAAPVSWESEHDYGLTANPDAWPLDHVQFWSGGGGALDEFRIGTTYEDVVSGAAGPIDGDINGDGQVDGLDLNLLGADWQSTSPVTPAADINNDGIVDGLDLNILGGNWQVGVPAPGAAIPEPASLALLGIGAIAMLRRRSA